jgi:hypothetical protein
MNFLSIRLPVFLATFLFLPAFAEGNFPREDFRDLWTCRAKHSETEIKIGYLPSDLQSRLQFERGSLRELLGPEHAFQGNLWNSQGGTHLCFRGKEGGNDYFYFFQFTPENFMSRGALRNVPAEITRFPNFGNARGCGELAQLRHFDQSEYYTCQTPGIPNRLVPIRPIAPNSNIDMPNLNFGPEGLQVVNVPKLNQLQFSVHSISAPADQTAIYSIAMVLENQRFHAKFLKITGTDTEILPLIDETLSQRAAQAAGLQARDVDVGFYDLVVDRENRLVIAGAIWAAERATDTQKLRERPFVTRVFPDGRIDTSFGNQGFVFLTAQLQNHPYRAGRNKMAIERMPDGQFLVSHIMLGAYRAPPAPAPARPAQPAAAAPQQRRQPSNTGSELVRRQRFVLLSSNGQVVPEFERNLMQNPSLTKFLTETRTDWVQPFAAPDGRIYWTPKDLYGDQDNPHDVFVIQRDGRLERSYSLSARTGGQACKISGLMPYRGERGYLLNYTCGSEHLLARHRNNGEEDSSFGSGSRVSVDSIWQGLGLVSRPTGSWVNIAEGREGNLLIFVTHQGTISNRTGQTLVRLDAQGNLDHSFAAGAGHITFNEQRGRTASFEAPLGLADGRIVTLRGHADGNYYSLNVRRLQ